MPLALPALVADVAARTATCGGHEIEAIEIIERVETLPDDSTRTTHIVRVETEGPHGWRLFATAEMTPEEIDGLTEAQVTALILSRAGTLIEQAAA